MGFVACWTRFAAEAAGLVLTTDFDRKQVAGEATCGYRHREEGVGFAACERKIQKIIIRKLVELVGFWGFGVLGF